MKKLLLALGLLLIALNTFAAGDLIVDGKVGVGTTTPTAPLTIAYTAPGAGAFSGAKISVGGTDASISGLSIIAAGGTSTPKNVYGANYIVSLRAAAAMNNWEAIALNNTMVLNGGTAAGISITDSKITPSYNTLFLNVAPSNIMNFASSSPVSLSSFRLYRDASGTVNINNLTGLLFDTMTDNAGSGTFTATNLVYADFREMHSGRITNILNTVGLKMLDLNIDYSTNNTNILIGAIPAGNWSIYSNSTKDSFLKGKLAFVQTDGNEYIDSDADGYLDLHATTSVDINSVLTLAPTSRPGSPVEGMMYADSTDHHLYFYNGSGWVQCDN